MMPANVKQQITELANDVLSDTDFFLIDINVKGGNRPSVSVFVDGSERNVNLDECAEISNELGFLIDVHEIFNDSYRINVSSPGLNRPLVDKRQYAKNKGREVTVSISGDENAVEVQGMLKEVDEDKIIIQKQDEPIAVPFDRIKETKVTPSLK